MKLIIVVICAVLLSFSAFAEKIKVTGKIDEETVRY